MILVASPSKPFQYTAKGSARRQAIIQDYEEEIEDVYRAVAETTQENLEGPANWDASSALDFVRKVVHGVLKTAVPDSADLFQYGCDR
jgi:hypothetical protein